RATLDAAHSPYTTLFRSSRLAVSCCHALASACVPIRGLSVAVTAFNDAGSKCLVFPLLKPEQRLHANMQIRPEGGTSLAPALWRSEEHTSELQSRFDLVC